MAKFGHFVALLGLLNPLKAGLTGQTARFGHLRDSRRSEGSWTVRVQLVWHQCTVSAYIGEGDVRCGTASCQRLILRPQIRRSLFKGGRNLFESSYFLLCRMAGLFSPSKASFFRSSSPCHVEGYIRRFLTFKKRVLEGLPRL